MVRYIKTAVSDPKSLREVRQLKDWGRLSNFKEYEITVYKADNEFLGYTIIYTFEYNNKYYISMDVLNPVYRRGRDRRTAVHKSFDDREQANAYFREITKDKEWKKVKG